MTKENFSFEIEDAFEIYRDPIGHYHHWTIVVGRLIEGTMTARQGHPIAVPHEGGVYSVSHAIGFEYSFHDRITHDSIQTSDKIVGVTMIIPAPNQHTIQKGGLAIPCSQEKKLTLLLELLERAPSHIFHGRGPEYPEYPCGECERILTKYPETIPQLQSLAGGADPYFADRASNALLRYFKK